MGNISNNLLQIINKLVDENKIDFSGTEKQIEKSLLQNLERLGLSNIKSQYRQNEFRVKNFNTEKPDIVIKDEYQNTSIIEIKLQPDRKRGSSRFERSIIDLLYLFSEKYYNNIEGYLLYIDREKTRYIETQHLLDSIKLLINFEIKVALDWKLCNNNKSEFIIFMVGHKKDIQ